MENTPTKSVFLAPDKRVTGKHPPSSRRTCVVCGKDLVKCRTYVLVCDRIAEKLVTLISDLRSVDLTVHRICSVCLRKLEHYEKFSEELQSMKERLLQFSNTSAVSPASSPLVVIRQKRMSKDSPSSSIRTKGSKLLKESAVSFSVSPRKRLGFSQPNVPAPIPGHAITEEPPISGTSILWKKLTRDVEQGNIAQLVMDIGSYEETRKELLAYVSSQISKESAELCSPKTMTSFQDSSKYALQNWSYEKQEKEMEEKAPMMLTCLKAAGVNPDIEMRKKKTYKTILPGLMTAAGVLFFCRNQHVSAHQTLTALALRSNGAGVTAIHRMHARGMAVSYSTLINKQLEMGKDYDIDVLCWKERVETEHAEEERFQESQEASAKENLNDFNKTRHPGFVINGDNVDLRINPRQMTMEKGSQDLHFYHMIAIENRIVDFSLPDKGSTADIKTCPLSTFLPTVDDNDALRNEWIMLVGQSIVKNVPALGWFRPYVPEFKQHKYMEATKKKSKVVNLGVLTENENTHEGMVAILAAMNKYIPETANGKQLPIISGGDLLTCERQMNAKLDRQDSQTSAGKWEGVIPVIDDFHTMANFLEVIWKLLYSSQSSRDPGTLFAAKNFLKLTNISDKPMKDVNAAVDFITKYTDALITSATLEFFGMDDVHSEQTKKAFHAMTMEPAMYVKEKIAEIVDKFAFHEGPDYSANIKFSCPHCKKEYVSMQGLRKHVKKEHGDAAPTRPTSTASMQNMDCVFQYSCAAMSLCLLFRDFDDARRYGDGERIIRLYKFLMLYFKLTDKRKYAYHSFRLLTQIHCTLAPRLAHILTWNRFVNHHGRIDTNIELDRENEHQNRVFKDESRKFHGKVSEATVDRISHCAQEVQKALESCDQATAFRQASGKHKGKDVTIDVQKLAQHLHKEQIFCEKGPRHHYAFPTFHKNPLTMLDVMKLQSWMRLKISEFSRH